MLRVNFSVVDENSGTYLMNNKFVKDVEIKAGLSLTVSCRQNRGHCRIALVRDHSVKDNERCLSYATTIVRYLNHIEPRK